MIITVIVYIKVFIKINLLGLDGENKLHIERLMYYPIVLLLVLSLLSIVRGMEIYNRNSCSFYIIYLIGYTVFALQGFLNAIIFFFNPTVKNCLKNCCRKRNLKNKFQVRNTLLQDSYNTNLLED